MRECRTKTNRRCNIGPPQEPSTANDRVQLEIPINTLRRLMAGQRLLIEDMHCLNNDSQQRVRQLLMDQMMGRYETAQTQ